jgi:hypothetical protein
MRIPVRAASMLAAFLGLSSLWGCAGSGSTAPFGASLAPSAIAARPATVHTAPNVLPPDVASELSVLPHGSVPSLRHPAKAAALVYSCEYYGSDCRIFNAGTHKMLSQLSEQDGLNDPQGNRTDAKGNWYIANTGAANVLEYSGDGSKLEATLDASGWFPDDVAVSGSLVAVSNWASLSFTPGVVNIYSGGATSPSYALSDPLAMEGQGVAFDSKGNCYWSFNNESGEGMIDEFPGCTASSTPTNLNIVTGFAGGIALDQHDNLWYVDQYHGVYKCAGTTNCKLYNKISLRPCQCHDPVYMNFNASDKSLYVADGKLGVIYRIDTANAKRGVFARTSKKDPPFGVATSP